MTENKSIEISVIIPIFNEEVIIPDLFERIKKAALRISPYYELIFVNDGSTDNSLSKLIELADKDDKVVYINFSRNFGHQIAVTAGIDYCSGNIVVIIDGDLQDPPELIPEMYAKYKEGNDVVYAKRRRRKGESYFKKMTAKFFYRLLNRITTFEIPLDTGDFRLMDRKVVNYLKQMPEQNKFLRGQIAWLGFKQTFVLFERQERKQGKTAYSFGKMMRFAMDGITGLSNKPLLLVSRTGIAVSTIAFLIILYAFYSHFILDRTISGWTSLMISSMFIGGVQLISIGIIGEYISRINSNTLNRPLYIIKESNIKTEEDIT